MVQASSDRGHNDSVVAMQAFAFAGVRRVLQKHARLLASTRAGRPSVTRTVLALRLDAAPDHSSLARFRVH